jgi:CO dehydrogenase maturation factor
MRVAFVGKGGSGKSTISAMFAQTCAQQGRNVLAIDLDYNMDMAFNLGVKHDLGERYISRSRQDFFAYTGLGQQGALKDLIARFDDGALFNPDRSSDTYSAQYAVDVTNKIKMMVVGPTPDDRLYGKECGHVFMSPIRYYLPLLDTDRVVVLDSTAGTDLVSFGMYQGADIIVCVVEPRENSIRVFEQIKPIAKEFNIPLYMFINKQNDATDNLFVDYQDSVIGSLPFSDIDQIAQSTDHSSLTELYHKIMQCQIDQSLRQQRLKQWKDGHDARIAA